MIITPSGAQRVADIMIWPFTSLTFQNKQPALKYTNYFIHCYFCCKNISSIRSLIYVYHMLFHLTNHLANVQRYSTPCRRLSVLHDALRHIMLHRLSTIHHGCRLIIRQQRHVNMFNRPILMTFSFDYL